MLSLVESGFVVLCVVDVVETVTVVSVTVTEVIVVVVEVPMCCPMMMASSGSLAPCFSHIITV